MKYELVKTDTKTCINLILYRIRACVAIPQLGVKAGDLGGYIESEKNLNHDDQSWVYDDAWVYGNARVYGNVTVCTSIQDVEVFSTYRVFLYDNWRDEYYKGNIKSLIVLEKGL